MVKPNFECLRLLTFIAVKQIFSLCVVFFFFRILFFYQYKIFWNFFRIIFLIFFSCFADLSPWFQHLQFCIRLTYSSIHNLCLVKFLRKNVSSVFDPNLVTAPSWLEKMFEFNEGVSCKINSVKLIMNCWGTFAWMNLRFVLKSNTESLLLIADELWTEEV